MKCYNFLLRLKGQILEIFDSLLTSPYEAGKHFCWFRVKSNVEITASKTFQ